MADNGVNKGRRRFLVGATSVVGAVGAVGVAVPFVASWQPSAKARAAGAPVQADISKLEPGQRMTVEWRGRPIWIINRTPEMIERTEALGADSLADPESEVPQQPAYIQGGLRSIKPEIGVLIGICTHLGCSPLYRPEPDAEGVGVDNWPGGFFCPCHGSRFDLAGRVFSNVPAPTNLEVPPYRFESDDIIVIGEDEESA
ncbi:MULTISPECIES: ubiquinol-cytochrome c reductase iron-sulfur subunit [Halomonadaceae]|jgi:ubiquinol-cytochrome c reductase iron-sulfur subunit|uniref:Ubiquinol-cytochrome c reductase iron-sulfur subunit n=1 Tax=Vreelandella aquamarina TaxID=77097 RepID=A0A1N6CQC9_9GAMM|nr:MULTISPECIES: ubiquinol-cytochrome c reductase iron-sulfur subunit [Halomonas]MEC7297032.1 ubiquinol-cytochrome c reductase iron-sulfur subunit [Pseudomonadota bacterium]MBV65686.1 ubiquinol-cytochrome c reductase iron-sulfur subunit [Halomonas sp.]MCC4290135.1 ubiquinol-cytochrome c reductase iron-sulfur subunit [Halomonas axialensis]MCF2911473.1 ubiquinol-cytochrome c reductase iron-sulfur subunit [Halomonas sp. Cn5-12]MCP1303883.1 ubiquinol-cytochrome c reductase iron-sulfur subunit [Hal|tara:strand:+ start:4214 stop:4813 length:600 start_codon:yes stop_codon:yes gene_type:complete